MAMDTVLKRLESKLAELLKKYNAAVKKAGELEAKVEKLQAASEADAASRKRVGELETLVE